MVTVIPPTFVRTSRTNWPGSNPHGIEYRLVSLQSHLVSFSFYGQTNKPQSPRLWNCYQVTRSNTVYLAVLMDLNNDSNTYRYNYVFISHWSHRSCWQCDGLTDTTQPPWYDGWYYLSVKTSTLIMLTRQKQNTCSILGGTEDNFITISSNSPHHNSGELGVNFQNGIIANV